MMRQNSLKRDSARFDLTEELPLWTLIQDCLHTHLPVALVSVVETAGSTPRKAGAKLAVALDGRSAGTIGGGETEHQAIMTARQQLRDKSGALLLESQPEGDAGTGPLCGGRQRLALDNLSLGRHGRPEWFSGKHDAASDDSG